MVRTVDEFCRSQSPPIGFISADVRGLFAMLFVDFGEGFEVVDTTGEELKETYISEVRWVLGVGVDNRGVLHLGGALGSWVLLSLF